MKIVHVVQRFRPAIGGAETHVLEVAREQARRGHDVTIATSARPDAPDDSRTDDGLRVRRFRMRNFRGQYYLPPWHRMDGMEDFLTEEKPDLYHAHSYRFYTMEHAAAASARTGRPWVATAHGFYPSENPAIALSRWRYDALRGGRTLKTAARCVAVTEHEVGYYERLGVARERIDVVPNGIPASALQPGDGARFRQQHGLEGPVVLFLARLSHDKGLQELVRASALVPGATFAVCGRDEGMLAPMQELARKLGVAQRVKFLGAVPDPRDAYAACDVFCLPSRYEAFGLVFLEAMAQGKAVVGADAGGQADVIADCGLVAPPRDPPALASALRALLDDPQRRATLGVKARARAESFLWPRIVDQLEETYRRALA